VKTRPARVAAAPLSARGQVVDVDEMSDDVDEIINNVADISDVVTEIGDARASRPGCRRSAGG